MLCQSVVGVAELTPTPAAPAVAKNVSPAITSFAWQVDSMSCSTLGVLALMMRDFS